jgi:hypothetical protein
VNTVGAAVRDHLRPTEHQIQSALVDWIGWKEREIPLLRLLYAVPNGAGLRHTVRTTRSGKVVRFSAEANKLRREGLRKGIPDMCWPVARGGFLSLYIEHKRNNEALSDAQGEIADLLREAGHKVCLSRSVDESIEIILDYWRQPPTVVL